MEHVCGYAWDIAKSVTERDNMTSQDLSIQWQTDPRRRHFLGLRIVLFIAGPLALPFAVVRYFRQRVEIQNRERDLVLSRDEARWQAHSHELFIDAFDHFRGTLAAQSISYVLMWIMQLPTIIALIVAGSTNNHSYLILGQKHCYASFVSSRSGYMNAYIVEASVKLGVFFGLNV
jgi:hypothetical protein